MEERRLLLAVALSLLVLTAYQFLFPSAPPGKRPGLPSPAPSGTTSASPPVVRTSVPAVPGPAGVPAAPAAGEIADTVERRVEAQGDDVTVAFSNRGARLVSWQLKRYRDAKGRPEEMVQTVPGGPRALDVE